MKKNTRVIVIPAITILLVMIGIALYLQQTLPPPSADEVCKNLAVMVAGLIVSTGFVFFILPKMMFPFLSDAQRYGIDENGVPQTPVYMAQKSRTASLFQVQPIKPE